MMKFRIFHDKNSEDVVSSVKEALREVFGIETGEEIQLNAPEVKGAYNTNRMQYDASNLLNYLVRGISSAKEYALCLWIVSGDLYVKGMNFVFDSISVQSFLSFLLPKYSMRNMTNITNKQPTRNHRPG
jgi:predicted Zn-dependent protease